MGGTRVCACERRDAAHASASAHSSRKTFVCRSIALKAPRICFGRARGPGPRGGVVGAEALLFKSAPRGGKNLIISPPPFFPPRGAPPSPGEFLKTEARPSAGSA